MMRKWHGIVLIVMSMLGILAGQAGSAGAEDPVSPFKDVSVTHWAYASIKAGVEKGYVSGFPGDVFKPDEPVTVAQFLAMLVLSFTERDEEGNRTWSEEVLGRMGFYSRETRVDGREFDFSQSNPWYQNYVNHAETLLMTDSTFTDFEERLTRERAARIICRKDNMFHPTIIDEYAKLAIPLIKDAKYVDKYLLNDAARTLISGIMSGYPGGEWKPKKVLTRAEALSIIDRINNESLRKPAKVNLTDVPYSYVSGYGFSEKQLFIFANKEMKQVNDELVRIMGEYQGVTMQDGARIIYFESEVQKELEVQRNFYFHDFGNPNIARDATISTGGNVYNIQLAKHEGRYERFITPLRHLLNIIDSERAKEFEQVIHEAIGSLRKGKNVDVKKMIGNRQISVISKSSEYYLSIGISAYADR